MLIWFPLTVKVSLFNSQRYIQYTNKQNLPTIFYKKIFTENVAAAAFWLGNHLFPACYAGRRPFVAKDWINRPIRW